MIHFAPVIKFRYLHGTRDLIEDNQDFSFKMIPRPQECTYSCDDAVNAGDKRYPKSKDVELRIKNRTV